MPRVWPALEEWGVIREAFSEEVVLKLRTEGWIGVRPGSESRENHGEGCTPSVVVGYRKGQRLRGRGHLPSPCPPLLIETELLLTFSEKNILCFALFLIFCFL